MVAVVVDVILPVLDEADALPLVLVGLPEGFHPIVVDNGSTDGSATVAARLGAEVVSEPRAGFGWACHAGLGAARSDVVCFMDADASFSGADLSVVAGPVVEGRADLVLGRRVPEAGAWPLHARLANRGIAAGLRRWSGVPLRDLGPIRAARRAPLIALDTRDRRFGWPLEMVMRVCRGRVAHRGGTGRLSPPDRSVEGVGHRPGVPAGRPGHGRRGPQAAMTALAVLAKTPRAGRSKTRLCPPCTLSEAAEVADAALRDTLDVARQTEASRLFLVLDGQPPEGLDPTIEVVAQRGDSLGERLSGAFADVNEALVLIGMDTPQVTVGLLDGALAEVSAGTPVLGAAVDGGWWALGLPACPPGAFDGVPMSTSVTFVHQRARLRSCGVDPRPLAELRDVDRWADALVVASEAPSGRFAQTVRVIDRSRRRVAS